MDQTIKEEGATQQKRFRSQNWVLLTNLLKTDLPTCGVELAQTGNPSSSDWPEQEDLVGHLGQSQKPPEAKPC